jgi:hypothetical protein
MRIEFFVKSVSQLSSFLAFIQDQNARHFPRPVIDFNLPNKQRYEDLMPYVKEVMDNIPTADLCVHYSLKNNRYKTMTESIHHLQQTIDIYSSHGVKELLLVSGSGDKRLINTVSCLQSLQAQGYQSPLKLSVAFNPYLLDDADELEEEKKRLKQKLDTGLVTNIYLQFGSEVSILENAVRFLHEELDLGRQPNKVKIYGSVFLPSKQLLNRMKFRPWKGLYLSPEFLNSVEEADQIVRKMLTVYNSAEIEPIIETAINNEKDIRYLSDLLHLESKGEIAVEKRRKLEEFQLR